MNNIDFAVMVAIFLLLIFNNFILSCMNEVQKDILEILEELKEK